MNLDRLQRLPKPLLFAAAGMICAFVGSSIGVQLNPFWWGNPLQVVWRDAILGLCLGLGIAVVQSWQLGRLRIAASELLRAAWISACGGAAGGLALVGIIVVLTLQLGLLTSYYIGLAVEGILIAMAVSRAIPNLKLTSASLGGLSAGCLGGLLTDPVETLARAALTDAIKGLLIGLSIAVAERLARKAWLVVKRNGVGTDATAGQPPTVLLGERPIAIGTSPDCAVVVRDAGEGPAILGEVRLERDLIILRDPIAHREQTLQPGQSLRFGDVTLEVSTRKQGHQS